MTGRTKLAPPVLAAALSAAFAGAAPASNYSFLNDAPASHFTDADLQLFEAAVTDALDHAPDGEVSGWSNPDTGASGRLKPLETYQSQGTTCRRLQIANRAGGAKSNVAFHFCRQPDQSWRVVK